MFDKLLACVPIQVRRVPGAIRQSGQALIESLVCAIALVPLVIGGVYLAKVQSVGQSSIAASRALAFECQVNFDQCASLNSNSVIADELRRRHFMHPSAGVESNQAADDAAAVQDKQVLWTDRSGAALLESYADVGFRVDADVLNSGSGNARGRAASVATNAFNIVSNLAGPGRFGLDWQGGLIDAKVEVRLSKSQSANSFVAGLNPMPLVIRSHTATLTDSWSATSALGSEASSNLSRVNRGKKLPAIEVVVDAMYLPVRGFLAAADAVGLEPDASQFKYHDVDVTIIPADRKPGYVAPSNQGGFNE